MIFLNQLDPKWSRLKLGRSWLTIGRWGCALMSLCMLSDRFGCYRSPDELAKIGKYFTSRGLVIWQNIPFERFRYVKRLRYRNIKEIDKWIVKGRGVILQVNYIHFVLVLRKENERYIIADPLGGEEKDLFKTYHYITGSVHFEEI